MLTIFVCSQHGTLKLSVWLDVLWAAVKRAGLSNAYDGIALSLTRKHLDDFPKTKIRIGTRLETIKQKEGNDHPPVAEKVDQIMRDGASAISFSLSNATMKQLDDLSKALLLSVNQRNKFRFDSVHYEFSKHDLVPTSSSSSPQDAITGDRTSDNVASDAETINFAAARSSHTNQGSPSPSSTYPSSNPSSPTNSDSARSMTDSPAPPMDLNPNSSSDDQSEPGAQPEQDFSSDGQSEPGANSSHSRPDSPPPSLDSHPDGSSHDQSEPGAQPAEPRKSSLISELQHYLEVRWDLSYDESIAGVIDMLQNIQAAYRRRISLSEDIRVCIACRQDMKDDQRTALSTLVVNAARQAAEASMPARRGTADEDVRVTCFFLGEDELEVLSNADPWFTHSIRVYVSVKEDLRTRFGGLAQAVYQHISRGLLLSSFMKDLKEREGIVEIGDVKVHVRPCDIEGRDHYVTVEGIAKPQPADAGQAHSNLLDDRCLLRSMLPVFNYSDPKDSEEHHQEALNLVGNSFRDLGESSILGFDPVLKSILQEYCIQLSKHEYGIDLAKRPESQARAPVLTSFKVEGGIPFLRFRVRTRHASGGEGWKRALMNALKNSDQLLYALSRVLVWVGPCEPSDDLLFELREGSIIANVRVPIWFMQDLEDVIREGCQACGIPSPSFCPIIPNVQLDEQGNRDLGSLWPTVSDEYEMILEDLRAGSCDVYQVPCLCCQKQATVKRRSEFCGWNQRLTTNSEPLFTITDTCNAITDRCVCSVVICSACTSWTRDSSEEALLSHIHSKLHVGKVVDWKQRGGLKRKDLRGKDQRNLEDQVHADDDEQLIVMNKDQSEVNRGDDDLIQILELSPSDMTKAAKFPTATAAEANKLDEDNVVFKLKLLLTEDQRAILTEFNQFFPSEYVAISFLHYYQWDHHAARNAFDHPRPRSITRANLIALFNKMKGDLDPWYVEHLGQQFDVWAHDEKQKTCCTSGMTSHHVQALLQGLRGPAAFQPTVRYQEFFSELPPDVAITYTWTTTLDTELPKFLELVEKRLKQNGLTFWIDILFNDQNSTDMGCELQKSEEIFERCRYHAVLMANAPFSRGWCNFEVAIRLRFALRQQAESLAAEGRGLSMFVVHPEITNFAADVYASSQDRFHTMLTTKKEDLGLIQNRILEIFKTSEAFDEFMLNARDEEIRSAVMLMDKDERLRYFTSDAMNFKMTGLTWQENLKQLSNLQSLRRLIECGRLVCDDLDEGLREANMKWSDRTGWTVHQQLVGTALLLLSRTDRPFAEAVTVGRAATLFDGRPQAADRALALLTEAFGAKESESEFDGGNSQGRIGGLTEEEVALAREQCSGLVELFEKDHRSAVLALPRRLGAVRALVRLMPAVFGGLDTALRFINCLRPEATIHETLLAQAQSSQDPMQCFMLFTVAGLFDGSDGAGERAKAFLEQASIFGIETQAVDMTGTDSFEANTDLESEELQRALELSYMESIQATEHGAGPSEATQDSEMEKLEQALELSLIDRIVTIEPEEFDKHGEVDDWTEADELAQARQLALMQDVAPTQDNALAVPGGVAVPAETRTASEEELARRTEEVEAYARESEESGDLELAEALRLSMLD